MILRKLPGPQDSGRHSGGDDTIRQFFRDDGAGSDDRVTADVLHDDGVISDPGPCADPDATRLPRLVADWNIQSLNAVHQRSTWAMHTRRKENIVLDVHPPEITIGTNVGIPIDAGLDA